MSTRRRPTWSELKVREMAEHSGVFAAYAAFMHNAKAAKPADPSRPFILVERPEDVPTFASEDEEHEYWGTHEMGPGFFDGAQLDDDERTTLDAIRRRRARRIQQAGS